MSKHQIKANDLPSPYDIFWKANLSDKNKAKKFIQHHLSDNIVTHINFTTLAQKPTEFIQRNLRKVTSDVLYSAKINDKDAYLYFLLEHQSTADEMMAFRMLLYSVEIMKWHLSQGHKQLPLVIPSVLYHGKQSPYPYSPSVMDCFEDVKMAKHYAFRSFELIDLTTMGDTTLAKFDPDLLFEYMLKHSRDNLVDRLLGMLCSHPDQAYYFLNAGKNLLNQIFFYIESRVKSDPKSIDQLIKVIDKNTEGAFMTYLERLEQKAVQQGVQQGMQQGMQQGIQQGMQQGALEKAKETAINLSKMGLPDDKITQATGLEKAIIIELRKLVSLKRN